MAKRSNFLIAALASLLLAGSGEAVQVYHSSANDGSADGACIPIAGSTKSLNLFFSHGSTDTIPAAAKCDGTGGEVEGDEVCMYDIVLETDFDVYIESFTPDPGQDIAAKVESNRIRIIGGDPTIGHVGSTRIGTLELSAEAPGELYLTEGRFLDTRLEQQLISSVGGIAYAEFDGDGDNICDGIDVCPDTYNRKPVLDSNGDGVPNDCQCGDPGGSGTHENGDLVRAYLCINPAPDRIAECEQLAIQGDTDGDGVFSNGDLVRIFNVITNQLHPAELSCPARLDGFIP